MKNNELNPNWVTGFVDAEGCFTVTIYENNKSKKRWEIERRFQIKLHIRDKDLILQIKSFFNNVGRIWEGKNFIYFCVSKISDILSVIVPHFNKYPLITKKQKDFLL